MNLSISACSGGRETITLRLIKVTRSNRFSVCMSCWIQRIEVRSFLAVDFSNSNRFSEVGASIPLKGSSSMSSLGEDMRALAKNTLCCCPPDSCPICRCAKSDIFTSSSVSKILSFISDLFDFFENTCLREFSFC